MTFSIHRRPVGFFSLEKMWAHRISHHAYTTQQQPTTEPTLVWLTTHCCCCCCCCCSPRARASIPYLRPPAACNFLRRQQRSVAISIIFRQQQLSALAVALAEIGQIQRHDPVRESHALLEEKARRRNSLPPTSPALPHKSPEKKPTISKFDLTYDKKGIEQNIVEKRPGRKTLSFSILSSVSKTRSRCCSATSDPPRSGC